MKIGKILQKYYAEQSKTKKLLKLYLFSVKGAKKVVFNRVREGEPWPLQAPGSVTDFIRGRMPQQHSLVY